MPLPPSEVRHTKPRFVDIEEDLVIGPEPQVFERPLLSEQDVLDAVAVDRDLRDLAELHAHFLLHHASDGMPLEVFPSFLQQPLLYLLNGVDDFIVVVHLPDHLLNGLPAAGGQVSLFI